MLRISADTLSPLSNLSVLSKDPDSPIADGVEEFIFFDSSKTQISETESPSHPLEQDETSH